MLKMNLNPFNYILSTLILFLTLNLNGQNVKYKKGEVFIDKELAFVILEKERTDKKEKRNFEMKDGKGNSIFTLMDTSVYYKQLAHELTPRLAYQGHILKANQLNRSILVRDVSMPNFRHQINYLLKKTDLYKTQEFNDDILNQFAELLLEQEIAKEVTKYEQLSVRRDSVNEQAIRYHGPLVKRESGFLQVTEDRVKEEYKTLYRYKIRKRTKFTHIYDMFNEHEEQIGWFNLFQSSKKDYDNVVIAVCEYGKLKDPEDPTPVGDQKMYFKVPRSKGINDQTDEARIKIITEYLVDIGAL